MIKWFVVISLSWIQPFQTWWPTFTLAKQHMGLVHECKKNQIVIEVTIENKVPGGGIKSARVVSCSDAFAVSRGLRK